MEQGKGAATEEFVTVVSVGSQPGPENFVTVLSIGTGKKEDKENDSSTTQSSPTKPTHICQTSITPDGYLEEEVEVFRLPGERLGFGLKFEGGNKTSERVRRLFVQSCAEQSPASRAKCSWGSLGEGDEVLAIDGVPVTHMTRLDCVRRLKESQLVIRLMVRCRGALRPEVVSAERKSSPEKSKVPPELPPGPPPVPPRKLRQPRGPADGEANPSPAKKSWNNARSLVLSQTDSSGSSPNSSQPSSQNSPKNPSQNNSLSTHRASVNSESTSYESCESSPKSGSTSVRESPKGSPKERSPDLAKAKQEPPEAMVYLDARSQSGSTHGSTSDDTGSSMSTVVDRFSSSDRVSTISTISTTSTTSEQPGDQDASERDLQLSRAICPLDRLNGEFSSTPPDYLLRRLASSEAVTHVESRGEVERITAVVAPNTVLIEETITFQPPLSFQDAPLSYGHEARPDLFYAADLAADSTTHFRPIKDDANSEQEEFHDVSEASSLATGSNEHRERVASNGSPSPPPLPARNHVNRISVNQSQSPSKPQTEPRSQSSPSQSNTEPSDEPRDVPQPPPKPLPRKDLKLRRKRPPPPPPPPIASSTQNLQPQEPRLPSVTPVVAPRREIKQEPTEVNSGTQSEDLSPIESSDSEVKNRTAESDDTSGSNSNFGSPINRSVEKNDGSSKVDSSETEEFEEDSEFRTNKVFEIIEIRKAKALSPQKANPVADENRQNGCPSYAKSNGHVADQKIEEEPPARVANIEKSKPKIMPRGITVSTELENSEDETDDARANCGNHCESKCKLNEQVVANRSLSPKEALGQGDSEEDDSSRSLNGDENNSKNSRTGRSIQNGSRREDETEEEEEDESSEESDDDDDYYWQSNLATIGEEEETNSLEYASANKDVPNTEVAGLDEPELEDLPADEKDDDTDVRNGEVEKQETEEEEEEGSKDFPKEESNKFTSGTVNGRMENCGGGQRLPPDGDEFPTAYQEFGKNTEPATTEDRSSVSDDHQQYRYLAASNAATTMTMTMTMSSTTIARPPTLAEPFLEKDGLKLLTIESNVITSRSIVLPESRITLATADNVCQEMNGIKLRDELTSSDKNVDNACHGSGIEERKPLYISDDLVKRTAPVMSYANYGEQANGNLEVSEKKLEITGYYHKDAPIIVEEVLRCEDSFNETPPPLPLTGPPKKEAIGSQTKNVPALEQTQRKFSLNGELWRQDDKSERSVRDKIAMFSSQSSLDAPLFPNALTVTGTGGHGNGNTTATAKKLSKYKSSEDVCVEEKSTLGHKDRLAFFGDRTQSSLDLTDSSRKYNPRPSVNLLGKSASTTIHTSKTFPVLTTKVTTSSLSPESPSIPKGVALSRTYSWSNTGQPDASQESKRDIGKADLHGTDQFNASNNGLKVIGTAGLTRATSFSGTTPYQGQERMPNVVETLAAGSPISRTNSLASTFRKPSDDIRKTSLNQLIEQRRKSISKLRGLVIPEKEAVPIDQPIVDLPEIKSRDFILLQQLPKLSPIQDKWGSQSSLASNASATSTTAKTTSFKMPAPQINSKYSPAFKRKSLTVYGTSIPSSSINGGKAKHSPSNSTTIPNASTAVATSKTATPVLNSSITSTTNNSASTTLTSTPNSGFTTEPPKSLESICSPTRSDYSFDFVSASNSPEGLRSKGNRIGQRKTRMDYDDSDNDSAVSSSQSSISRGFSPPMSPVPSERSTVSSERSYLSTETNYQRRSLIMDNIANPPNRGYDLAAKTNLLAERLYPEERSSSSSSSSDPRSPQPADFNFRNSQIPQRQTVRRSNSTDTNCSTSSTLTSGSQASAESLSRRVLKPQSVEAINRKNILASARCRSGRELNGSPLIQRKFTESENQCSLSETDYPREGRATRGYDKATVGNARDVKVAYIEVTDSFTDDESYRKGSESEPKLPPKRSIPQPVARPPKSELLEPSNDLRMWVRAEARALESRTHKIESSPTESPIKRNGVGRPAEEEEKKEVKIIDTVVETDGLSMDRSKPRIKLNSATKSTEEQNDLLTILTTRSRSRSAIHVDDGTFGRSKNQMSLEEMLSAKSEKKTSRGPSSYEEPSRENKNDAYLSGESKFAWGSKEPCASKDDRWSEKNWPSSNDLRSEDKAFVSKIPTFGKSRTNESATEAQLESSDRNKSASSKIPMAARNLARRSASVTDMKKALERTESSNTLADQRNAKTSSGHSRFPSLDSSVDKNLEESAIGGTLTRTHPLNERTTDPASSANPTDNTITSTETERYCGEQFGSISSLASSTSLISQQELAQLVEEANLEEVRGAQDVIVVLLHKENPTGSVGITLGGGADCEVKEITVHRVLAHSIADRDGRVQRGDRILSINGRSTRGLTHRDSLTVLKQPRSEVVLVVSRAKPEELCKLRSRTASVETIIEGFESNGVPEDTAWGPPSVVAIYKDGAGLGFSLEGGRDSPLGDRPLVIKKIFTGGAAEKTGALRAGDQLLEVNGSDVTRMSRIEAWSLMKKLHDGEVNLLVRHPATKSS